MCSRLRLMQLVAEISSSSDHPALRAPLLTQEGNFFLSLGNRDRVSPMCFSGFSFSYFRNNPYLCTVE